MNRTHDGMDSLRGTSPTKQDPFLAHKHDYMLANVVASYLSRMFAEF